MRRENGFLLLKSSQRAFLNINLIWLYNIHQLLISPSILKILLLFASTMPFSSSFSAFSLSIPLHFCSWEPQPLPNCLKLPWGRIDKCDCIYLKCTTWEDLLLTKHLDSAPSFPTWKKVTFIPWALNSYYNAPMIKQKTKNKTKKPHQIRTCRFPYHLIKYRKNYPDATNWLFVPSMFATKFLRPKSVIISQAVLTKVV